MSSAREAQGTVSQKRHADTSGNHRESSPTLSAAGYGAKGTEETQGTARSRAPLREASAGTQRQRRAPQREGADGSHKQHRVSSFCQSLNGIRQLLQFLVISALASVSNTLTPVSILPLQVLLHRVSPPNHAVPKAGQERLEDDVFYVFKFPAFGSFSHRSEGSKFKRQESLTESLRIIGKYSLLSEPQLVF